MVDGGEVNMETANLIRLITSGDEAQLELAIQLNIGLKLLTWEEFIPMITLPFRYGSIMIKGKVNFKTQNLSLYRRLSLGCFLFSKSVGGKQLHNWWL